MGVHAPYLTLDAPYPIIKYLDAHAMSDFVHATSYVQITSVTPGKHKITVYTGVHEGVYNNGGAVDALVDAVQRKIQQWSVGCNRCSGAVDAVQWSSAVDAALG